MLDGAAKRQLLDELRWVRTSLVDAVTGLSEHDARRPLTRTGTNLLGLVQHLTISEACYLGSVMGRPLPEPVPRYDDPGFRNRDHLWVPADRSCGDVLAAYDRACRHADETVEALPLDAPGLVPWWPQPQVTLLGVLLHQIAETNRHAGHADILREGLDARSPQEDDADWEAHRAVVEHAARDAGA